MSVEYIRNRKSSDRYLEYDSALGKPLREVGPEALPGPPRKKANYIRHGNDFIGVIGSEYGPVLFINDHQYPFRESWWSAEVQEADSENQFIIQENGREVLRIAYPPAAVDELDPWSDEETEDFFKSVAAKQNDQEFIEMWTLE